MTDWQPLPQALPPLERQVQARYWTLAKHARQAVCEGVAHPLGIEVTVSVAGEMVRDEVARTPAQAQTLPSQWCAAFIDKDWNPSGPGRAPAGALRWVLHRRGLEVLCESLPRLAALEMSVLAKRGEWLNVEFDDPGLGSRIGWIRQSLVRSPCVMACVDGVRRRLLRSDATPFGSWCGCQVRPAWCVAWVRLAVARPGAEL